MSPDDAASEIERGRICRARNESGDKTARTQVHGGRQVRHGAALGLGLVPAVSRPLPLDYRTPPGSADAEHVQISGYRGYHPGSYIHGNRNRIAGSKSSSERTDQGNDNRPVARRSGLALLL